MSSYFRLRHRRSMNTLSIQRPRPSMEILIPAAISVPVKAALVNGLPWSVLKISGLPKRANASSSADTQNDTSMVLDSRPVRHAHHEGQHRPACPVDHCHEIEEPAPDRYVGDVRRPHLVRPVDRQV